MTIQDAVTQLVIFMAEKVGEDTYNIRHLPVTYRDINAASQGLVDYTKFYPNTLFLLVDAVDEIILSAATWTGTELQTDPNAVGKSAHFFFHTHDANEDE